MLRAEFEARGRDVLRGQNNLYYPDGSLFDNPQVRATDGWSTMANLWRDFDVGERLALDLGYRFCSIGTGNSGITAPANPFGDFGGSATSSFSAIELLLTVRVCEPFRNWR